MLVEDNSDDEALTLRALKKNNILPVDFADVIRQLGLYWLLTNAPPPMKG
jgi:hypothetical protein